MYQYINDFVWLIIANVLALMILGLSATSKEHNNHREDSNNFLVNVSCHLCSATISIAILGTVFFKPPVSLPSEPSITWVTSRALAAVIVGSPRLADEVEETATPPPPWWKSQSSTTWHLAYSQHQQRWPPQGAVLVDFHQGGGGVAVSPTSSTTARRGGPTSTPLTWQEHEHRHLVIPLLRLQPQGHLLPRVVGGHPLGPHVSVSILPSISSGTLYLSRFWSGRKAGWNSFTWEPLFGFLDLEMASFFWNNTSQVSW